MEDDDPAITERDRRIAELKSAVRAALNIVDGNGVPPNWDWMRAVLADKSAEYYRQHATQKGIDT